MKKLACFACCALAVALSGCGSKGKAIANIGGNKITVKTLTERIMDAPPAYQSYLSTDAGRRQFLDLMIREQIVIESAKKAGVKKQSEFKKMMSDFKKEQARKTREYKDNLLMELYVRQLHDKELSASEKEVENYYNEHKADFTRPLEITAKHILVATRPEAEKVLARLKAGENFSKIAKEVSADPISAQRGGEIGPFRRGDLVPEFEKAVFPLKLGKVSDITETQFGFHIIIKMKEKVLPARSLESSSAELKKYIEKTKFDAWLEKAKAKLNFKVDYSMLSLLPAPAGRNMMMQEGSPEGEAR